MVHRLGETPAPWEDGYIRNTKAVGGEGRLVARLGTIELVRRVGSVHWVSTLGHVISISGHLIATPGHVMCGLLLL